MKPLFNLLIALLRTLLPFFNKNTREKIGSIVVAVWAITTAIATYAPQITNVFEATTTVESPASPLPDVPVVAPGPDVPAPSPEVAPLDFGTVPETASPFDPPEVVE